MISPLIIAGVGIGYLIILFALAYTVDRQPGQGARAINSSVVYTFSLATYCTSWTFYGSVGLASKSGIAFLPIYLGPILRGWERLKWRLKEAKVKEPDSLEDKMQKGKVSWRNRALTLSYWSERWDE